MKITDWKHRLRRFSLAIVFISYLLSPISYLFSQDITQLVSEGNKFIKEKKYDEAVKILLKAKAMDEKSPLPDVAMGMMFLQKDNLKKAEAHLKAAEALKPELAAVQYTLALLYEKKDEKENAIKYWNKLLQNPDFKDIAEKHLRFLGDVK